MRASDEQHTHCPQVPRARHLLTMRVFRVAVAVVVVVVAIIIILAVVVVVVAIEVVVVIIIIIGRNLFCS